MSRAALVPGLVALTALTLAAQEWNGWRGPSRSGVAATFAAPAAWPDRPRKVWEVRAGVGHSSPVVTGGRVFQFSRVGEDEVVSAFEQESGKELWQHRYAAPYQMNPAAQSHGKGPKSTPVAVGGRLFTIGITGICSALDVVSGKLLWRRSFDGQFDAPAPDFGVAMSPLVEGTTVIVQVGGTRSGAAMALDVSTGATRWQWKNEGPAYASPVSGTFGGTRQIVTQSRAHMVGLAADTGRELWRIPFSTPYDQNIVTPIVIDDLVLYSGIEQPLAALRVRREGAKWTTEPVWRTEAVPMYMSTAVAVDGHVYGFTHRNKGQFFALDPRTGKVLWATRGREAENAALIAAGDLLIASTTEGELVVARRNPARFELLKRYTIAESPVWAHPVPAGRGILIKGAETLTYWVF